MLRDGESGLGVEGEDEPKRHPEERFLFPGFGNSRQSPEGRPTIKSGGGPDTVQSVLETRKHKLVALYR